MEGKGPGREERIRAISTRLAGVLGEGLDGEMRRLSSGASRETFMFATPSRGELVVQIGRHGTVRADSPPQAPLLTAAAGEGVPVPLVIAHGRDDDVLGPDWTVLEALPGTTDPGKILAGEGSPDRENLIEDIARALAAVHRMPAQEDLAPAVEEPIALLRDWHDRLGQPHPTFELAFRALESAPPPSKRRTLVHGDFRMGNLMFSPRGLTGVLDWELAHLGDPLEDLGWLCVPAWRFTRPDLPAAGLGTREQLIAAYERHAGVEVDPKAVRWWELAGTLRWGVICVMQAFTHLSGATRSIEHAVIGRRACEVEWDLLDLLESPSAGDGAAADGAVEGAPAGVRIAAAAAVEGAPAGAPLHDRPTVLELLDAARGALGDDVLPQLEGRAAFQLRVTLRALGIVGRELALAEQHAAVHGAVLEELGLEDEAAVAEAIRTGELDGNRAIVVAALRASVRAKLEVANPGYLEQSSAKEEQ